MNLSKANSHSKFPPTVISASRVDVYRYVHKALRSMMADTLTSLGRMDPRDNHDVAEASDKVLMLAAACESHIKHENLFIHPAMDARAPGTGNRTGADHDHHGTQVAALGRAVQELRAAKLEARDSLALALYHQVGEFIAQNFEHMHFEETANNAVLWACYSDEELKSIHDALLGSIPPEEMIGLLRWAIPALNAGERMLVLADLQAHMPAADFQLVVDVVRPHLQPLEWQKLESALHHHELELTSA
jgi:iron-sulfur cluster repair protein YtfE (RIC family)